MTGGVAAIIPAAGRGLRLSAVTGEESVPKALRLLGGQTLLRRSAEALASRADVLVAAAPLDRVDDVRLQLADLPIPVTVVAGGVSRAASVAAALDAVGPGSDFVLVHDAARPLVPREVVDRVVASLHGGAQIVVPVVDVADSLRWVAADGTSRPLDRAGVRAVQTPQGFPQEVLIRAYRRNGDAAATDDASLAQRLGIPVTLVEGHPLAFKITRALDLVLAEAALRGQR